MKNVCIRLDPPAMNFKKFLSYHTSADLLLKDSLVLFKTLNEMLLTKTQSIFINALTVIVWTEGYREYTEDQRILCESGATDFIKSPGDLCNNRTSPCRDGSHARYCQGNKYVGHFDISSAKKSLKIRNPDNICFCPANNETQAALCRRVHSSRVACHLCEDEASFLEGVNCQTTKTWTDLRLNGNAGLLKRLILQGTWNPNLTEFPKASQTESCPATLTGFRDCGTLCQRSGANCNEAVSCPAGQEYCQGACMSLHDYCSRCAENSWHCSQNTTATCLSNSQKCAGACKSGFQDCHGLCQPIRWRCKELPPKDTRTTGERITDFLTSRAFLIVAGAVLTVAVLAPIIRHKRKKQMKDYQMGNVSTWVD